MCDIFFFIGEDDFTLLYKNFTSSGAATMGTFTTFPNGICLGSTKIPHHSNNVYFICNRQGSHDEILKSYAKYKEEGLSYSDIALHICDQLEEEYSYVLLDINTNTCIVARNGNLPLYIGIDRSEKDASKHVLGFASNVNALSNLIDTKTGCIDRITRSRVVIINVNDFFTKGFWNSSVFLDINKTCQTAPHVCSHKQEETVVCPRSA